MTGSKIIAGLDVGTTKICVMTAEISDGTLNVLGIGRSDSAGVRKGVIVNTDAAADSIKTAVKEAESLSGRKIKSVYAGISGGHVRCSRSSGAASITDREVRKSDMERAIDSASSMYIPLEMEALHVLPTEFVLDGCKRITDPTGMSGTRLEAEVNIITASRCSVQNLLESSAKANLNVDGIVLNPLVSAYSALTEDEKQSGAIMLDIGGGTTGIVLYKGGCMRNVSVLGVGGSHITNDIAVGLSISVHQAEKIKKDSGIAVTATCSSKEDVAIIHENGEQKRLPAKALFGIMRPRCEEILEMAREEIKSYHANEIPGCGVILTGGTSHLKGLDRLAETVLGLPVRIGRPFNLRGLRNTAEGPAYSAAAGLLAYAAAVPQGSALTDEMLIGILKNMRERVSSVFKYIDFMNLNQRKEGGVLCLKLKK